jgi:hypothetical protein
MYLVGQVDPVKDGLDVMVTVWSFFKDQQTEIDFRVGSIQSAINDDE